LRRTNAKEGEPMTDYRRAWLGDTWLFAINLLHRRGNDLTRNRIVARRRD